MSQFRIRFNQFAARVDQAVSITTLRLARRLGQLSQFATQWGGARVGLQPALRQLIISPLRRTNVALSSEEAPLGSGFDEAKGGYRMRAFLTSIALAAAIYCCLPSQASAWTCMAAGSSGRTATGSAILVERAGGIALRRCERRNPGAPCAVQWCR